MTIAILLAVFNRKEKTLACLESLYNQKLNGDIKLQVFITDDNSTDGTATEIKKEYPEVKVLMGSGSLFWAGGMRNSWREAIKIKPEYYLLLNDDTLLFENAISQLLAYNEEINDSIEAICIGSTYDDVNKNISYGGHKLYNKNRVQYHNVQSDTSYQECDLANANIMLVPAAIVEKIGILSEDYTHSIADFDYTLRAKKAGFKNIVVPGVLGSCTDDHGKNWKSANVSLSDRIKYLKSPKGLGYNEYLHFIKVHFPLHLPEAFVKLWLKTLFPLMWEKFKK